MSIYLTEEEQLAAIASWFKRYQRVILSLSLVSLLLGLGTFFWSSHVARVHERSALAYERLMTAVAERDNQAVRAYGKQLSVYYARTVYRDVAHLTLARYYVSRSEWQNACNELQMVIHAGHTPALQALAAMRLTRIFVLEKKYSEALEHIQHLVESPGARFIDLVKAYELQGDIYRQLSRTSSAKITYQKAYQEAKRRGVINPFLEMKMASIEITT